MWIEGVDILSHGAGATEFFEATNPFTGEKIQVPKRQKSKNKSGGKAPQSK
jgi:hypothetical protein